MVKQSINRSFVWWPCSKCMAELGLWHQSIQWYFSVKDG